MRILALTATVLLFVLPAIRAAPPATGVCTVSVHVTSNEIIAWCGQSTCDGTCSLNSEPLSGGGFHFNCDCD